jgi:hypothetical protein
MAIGTSNVSFSVIATELGATANSNVSLSALGTQQVILNPSNGRQTYALTDTITLSSQDSATADNMNMTSSSNVEVSEFKSYTQANPIQFSSSSGSNSSNVETVSHNQGSITEGGCSADVGLSGAIYAKRSGSDLVWYAARGNQSSEPGTHRKEGSTLSSDTEVARLAGVGSSTNVSVALTNLEQTSGSFASTSGHGTVSTGSTSSSLASTNTKIGFEIRVVGIMETNTATQTLRHRYRYTYTVTAPSKRARTFAFFVKVCGVYTAQTPFNQC